jgi:hypothetical protein
MADGKKPNVLFILSDDIGIWNISAYHRGMLGGRTPNTPPPPLSFHQFAANTGCHSQYGEKFSING